MAVQCSTHSVTSIIPPRAPSNTDWRSGYPLDCQMIGALNTNTSQSQFTCLSVCVFRRMKIRSVRVALDHLNILD
jgi:hypothetical protein